MDTVGVLGQAYQPRVIDIALDRALTAAGAVVIEGARASGKTMTALQAAGSYVFIDDVETQRALEIAPRSILQGEAPRLLDEWQVAPELWNLVRRAVDASTEPGRFILTGSVVPADDVTPSYRGRQIPQTAATDHELVREARAVYRWCEHRRAVRR